MARKHTRGQGSVYRRGKWWHVCFSIDGRTYRESAHTQNKDEALAYLQRKLGNKASGEVLVPDRIKIKDLLDMVLKDWELRGKENIYIEALRVKKHILPAVGELRAIKFGSTQIDAYIRQRQKAAENSTINRELALIRRGFTLGYRAEPKLIASVPHFRKLEEDNVRQGFLTEAQYRRLLQEMPKHLKLLLVFGYYVGLRRGALLNIKWSQVDRKEGVVWLEGRKTKNRKPVPIAVPIYGDMAQYLEQQPKDSEYLFARGEDQIKDFRASWRAACIRAGVPKLLFHDLRRTAARNLRRAGVPESIAMKITGHKTRSMFERYNITDTRDIKEAGRQTEEFLKGRAREEKEPEETDETDEENEDE